MNTKIFPTENPGRCIYMSGNDYVLISTRTEALPFDGIQESIEEAIKYFNQQNNEEDNLKILYIVRGLYSDNKNGNGGLLCVDYFIENELCEQMIFNPEEMWFGNYVLNIKYKKYLDKNWFVSDSDFPSNNSYYKWVKEEIYF